MVYWQKGKELNEGNFVVEELLVSGGFGVTYRVKEVRTNKLFVVKTLKPELKKEPNFRRLQLQFVNEVITLASCRHPNIVRVSRKVFEQDELICMVMQYIEGQTLGQYIRDRGKLSEADAIALIVKIGNALSYVHQQDLLHRDIKPDNIMLRQEDNAPVLIDFGLARELIIDLTRQSMSHAGTPFYAPIEEYESRGNYGAWTDIYALAATLYVLVTGESQGLFSYIRKYEFIANQRDLLIPPKKQNPSLSDRTNAAILKGMAIEPSDRPQTIEEWLELLELSEQNLKSDKYLLNNQRPKSHISPINKKSTFKSKQFITPDPQWADELAKLKAMLAETGNNGENEIINAQNQEIYIGNLNFQITEEDLIEVFSEYGTVEQAKIPKDHNTGKSLGFGFVHMRTEAEKNRAIEALNKAEWMDNTIRVRKAILQDYQKLNNKKSIHRRGIYIGNLNFQITEEDLIEVFSEYGTVEQAKIPKDHNTGKSRGFGFVHMKAEAEENRAIEALNEAEWIGRIIYVKKAK